MKDKNKRKFWTYKRSESLAGYLFVIPILLLMAVWFYYPVVRSFIYSLHDINFLNPDRAKFVGFDNYVKLLHNKDFLNSLKVSFLLTFIAVPVQTILALVIATLLNSIKKFRGVYRTLYYLPYITSTIAVTTVFMYLFVEKKGIATRIMTFFGMKDVSWYADVNLALPFLIILCVWTYVGFYVVVYLSGLQSIPNEIYEAARVDGANVFQRFWYVTVPMLKPTTFLVVTSGIIYTMQIFDQPYAIARGSNPGGPAGATTGMIIYFYQQAFIYNKAGYGSAAAFIIFLIIITFTIIQKLVFEKKEEV
ncbi:carbohydrate ABC transporter permease [Clostridium ganghwense]|uniref:Sugar ABC transporter permease n=1 Tax=Clostridium ganghwense TaxID=312089 RepID=A0ABT4CKE6_9CLOT|nr:sugar ABC transporter permease [Clostridium ganghwense]MCY6369519.1 sugar ABC transporter permease [Clostridium ganghwense]